MIDFYGEKLNTYKANMHTHTTVSDGIFSPAEVAELYADAGYDILCFTDHGKTNDIDNIPSCGMLLISGVELHPAGGRIPVSHLLCVDVPKDFDVSVAQNGLANGMQQVIDAVNRAGGSCYLAHPYWCGFRSTEIAELTGLAGIEVYNTSTRYRGKEYSMVIWDELSDMGSLMPALAVDDIHRRRDLFRGWSVICSKDRSKDSIMSALRKGEFYSTQGPEFKRISYKDGIFEAEFSPVTSAILMSNKSTGFCATVPNGNGDGQTEEITECRFEVIESGKPVDYLRLQIIDSEGRFAWTNPIPAE